MKMTYCPNKHFYDADRYDTCPHCPEKETQAKVTQRPDRPDIRPGSSKWPNLFKSNERPHTSERAQLTDVKTNKMDMTETLKTPSELSERDNLKTAGIYDLLPVQKTEKPSVEQTIPLYDAATHSEREKEQFEQIRHMPAQTPEVNLEAVSVKAVKQPESPVQNYSADDNRTIGFYGDFKTPHYVVGWLVCIDGEQKGRSFPLKDGKNFIGRDLSMDVQILDPKVSQKKHAAVQYDPNSKTFKAVEGDAGGLAYLNDNPDSVEGKVSMNKNDVLRLGKTKLMLIPCCDEAFCWSSDE